MDKTMAEAIAAFEKQFDPKQEAIAEDARQRILARFPLTSWPTMPLEEYAMGNESTDNFCTWMEFKTPEIASIKGGAATKHLIYRQKNTPGKPWYFDRTSYQNEQEAWTAVRAGFIEAFNKAEKGQWEEIDEIAAIQNAKAMRGKAVYVYFPDEMFPVFSSSHIRYFLRLFGAPEDQTKQNGVIANNRLLWRTLKSRPEFDGWGKKKIMSFLYSWNNPRETKRIVKIAPGDQGKYWNDCREGGYVCVGWDEIGDLREFESEESFRSRFAELFGEGYKQRANQIRRKANELWTLMELEAGDLVIANKGVSKILAVGEVVEPGYEWMESRTDYKHIVRIKWDTSVARDLVEPQNGWAFVTVANVSAAKYARLFGSLPGLGEEPATSPPPPPVDPLLLSIADAIENKGQAILYGPPGTGKTYSAERFAVWWLKKKLGMARPEETLADAESLLKARESLSDSPVSRRTWWVVASPKEWSWDELNKFEEFRYGHLTRNYPLVQPGDLVVGYEANPKGRIVTLARIARGLHLNPKGDQKILIEAVAKIEDGPTYTELKQDPVMTNSEPMRNRCQGTLFALTEAEAEHLALMLSEKNPELQEHFSRETTGGHLTRLTFHASYSYEDFIEGFRPVETGGALSLALRDGVFKKICREAQAHPDKPYLVIIDEINRANVAKVFGEIVTLLEKDKRDLPIWLPQSGERFSIPKNLYLLGTMNTADRSIKLLDAALRRRFAFIELMPDVELLRGAKVGNLALDDFLEQLNLRIAEHEGREKQIGHSFLLEGEEPISTPEEFARRFRQEILPLLQEFCYDDYQALAKFIGAKLVDDRAQRIAAEVLDNPDRLLEVLEAEFRLDEET